jgi:CelD/BcsL family acetyltransferase involved in cellulose biosynthesis
MDNTVTLNKPLRLSRALRVEALTELREIEALAAEWESLVARSTCNRGFGSARWFIASCRHNPSFYPYVIVARRGETLAGILPLVLGSEGKQAMFANYLTDYNDAIADAKDFEAIAALLQFACSRPNGYTSINLKHLRPDSNCLRTMTLLKQENAFEHTFRETLICYYLELPATHDGFLKNKDSRFRKRLKRLQALAQKAGLSACELDPVWFHSSQLPDLFLSLHLERRKIKSCFESSAAQNFAIEVLPPLFEKGIIRACVLMNHERIVAIDLYTISHNSLCVWNGGFLDEFGYCSPGKLLINEGIKLAFATNAEEFDFLRGGEAYKESWVNRSRSIGQLEVIL